MSRIIFSISLCILIALALISEPVILDASAAETEAPRKLTDTMSAELEVINGAILGKTKTCYLSKYLAK